MHRCQDLVHMTVRQRCPQDRSILVVSSEDSPAPAGFTLLPVSATRGASLDFLIGSQEIICVNP